MKAGLVATNRSSHHTSEQFRSHGASTALDRFALRCVHRALGKAPICLELWDGFRLGPERDAVPGTIRFKTRMALYSCLWDPELYSGETYMAGTVEVEGDLEAVLEAVYRAWPIGRSHRVRISNDLTRSRSNVHAHYDLGNDFYGLWLDRELLYTCAYYPNEQTGLEQAQIAKMDRICRKLGLCQGDRVVDAGCGWGALALFMARRYGAHVRAFNLSREQVAYARHRARTEGLAAQVEFIEDDYRNIGGACDVFVSIGMLEHVGLAHFDSLGQVIARVLAPNGRGLLHFIGRNQPAPLNAWMRKRIFPGAYPPTLAQVFDRIFEPRGLSVLDVENLRLHYAATLAEWRRRFRAAREEVRQRFGDPFVQAWDLYLAGSQAAFATGGMQLFQIVFAPGPSNVVPWTRDRSHAGWPREPWSRAMSSS